MSFINKMKKDTTEYEIQDIRMPEITNADVGKYLKVKDDLSLEFAEAGGGSGSGQLYKHLCNVGTVTIDGADYMLRANVITSSQAAPTSSNILNNSKKFVDACLIKSVASLDDEVILWINTIMEQGNEVYFMYDTSFLTASQIDTTSFSCMYSEAL